MKVSASTFFPYIRSLLSDTKAERYEDLDLLMYFQDALYQLSLIKPYAFSTYLDFEVEDENVLQKLPDEVSEIIDIHATNENRALKETEKSKMDEMTPDWISKKPSVPIQWMRDKRSDNAFFLYPTPLKGTILTLQCVVVPLLKDIDDKFNFSRQYQPLLVGKTVSIALSTSSEPKNNQLGAMFNKEVDKIIEVDAINEKRKLEDKN